MSARSCQAAAARWRGVKRWLLAAAWLAQAGCASAPADVLGAQTSDGRPVRELVAADRPTVILHYPASFFFACGQDLGEWVEHDRTGRFKLVLLLTDEPSAGTRRALAVRRIHVAGIVAPPASRRLPREYLVENGEVRIATADRGAGRNSPVLAAARRTFRSAGARAETIPTAPAVPGGS